MHFLFTSADNLTFPGRITVYIALQVEVNLYFVQRCSSYIIENTVKVH
jgi:hypothetical protein